MICLIESIANAWKDVRNIKKRDLLEVLEKDFKEIVEAICIANLSNLSFTAKMMDCIAKHTIKKHEMQMPLSIEDQKMVLLFLKTFKRDLIHIKSNYLYKYYFPFIIKSQNEVLAKAVAKTFFPNMLYFKNIRRLNKLNRWAYYACLFNDLENLRDLFKHYAIDIDRHDSESRCSLLRIACQLGYLEIVKLLFKKDSPSIDLQNFETSPLLAAYFSNHLDIVSYIIENSFEESAIWMQLTLPL